ncbi:Signal transduction histidine-protein kinase/phosphatase DegS [Candidatus Thermoflexus japonica]|uniref:histidine kinase n=1 Tax=Candidatus Thermoflexus japonica TaxID=2035417 RepID=A0A2H5Y819_9CHLR|nr:Signal transduction histidine-protein kinase/phosphatase DegS [Candidatus Thermoflexus japonica]
MDRKAFRELIERFWEIAGGVSVRTKILGIVLGGTLLFGLTTVLQVRYALHQVLVARTQDWGIAMASDLAARSADLVLINDLLGLHRLLQDAILHNSELRYLFVLSPQGEVLAHTFGTSPEFPAGLIEANPLPPGAPYRLQPLRTPEGIIWDIAVPIFRGRAGVLRLGLRDTAVRTAVNTVTAWLMLTTMVVSALSIGIALVLTHLIVRPIRSLVEMTERVARRDFTARATVWAHDEIGALAQAFNTMVEELAQQEQTRAFYLRRIIEAQEEERRRIARELHDETGQALASLWVGLRNLEQTLDPDTLRTRLEDLYHLVDQTLNRVRRLAFELRPSVLDDLGLVAALERYIRDYRERFGIEVEMQIVGLDERRIPPTIETAVYRIVQEALTNAAKHARCQRISVLLQASPRLLSVIVEDDGCGFDVEQALQAGRESRLGLYGMRERAQLVGGTLTIESTPGQGTTIYLRVPLESA